MLTILIIILVLIGAAVVGSIYSNFMVFYSNFSETENYHKAYYASISALERAELVIKQRQPGYEGSGGFVMGVGTGSYSNGGSDKSLSGFSYYGDNKDDTTVFRSIKSRTNRIPATGDGDVEWMLSADDSENYNMMDYENSEIFLLYNDKSSGNPYKKVELNMTNRGDISQVSVDKAEGKIRLPKLLSGFGGLDTGNALVGNGTLPRNDAIVDWQVRGYSLNSSYGTEGFFNQFTIYSSQSFDFGGNKVNIKSDGDSVFRESDINDGLNFNFLIKNSWSPISRGGSIPVIIEGGGMDYVYSAGNLKNVLEYKNSNMYIANNIRFSLLNLLQTTSNQIYPFLEYYIDFGNSQVPDKYWTIDVEGAYKDYKVNMIIKKPTVKETVFGSFTSIF